jgi:hypothetical protein
MNNAEISRFFRSHPLTKKMFRGVFSVNDQPKIKDGLYVFNTLTRETPRSKVGHWVVFLVRDKITYFDSTGLPEIELTFDCKVERSEKVVQSLFSVNCGLYVLYFGLSMMRGDTLKEFLSQFGTDLIKNDTYIISKMMIEYELKKYYK